MIKIGKNISEFSAYSCQPKTKEELKEIIKDRISNDGSNCDLNDIDVSLIEDMSWLFYGSKFNGDISNWNISNVNSMRGMFKDSQFNRDISRWDVNNVRDMNGMFVNSKFNQDISNWKIRKDCNIRLMFTGCHIRKEFKPKSLQS